jgi:hypothetical protein
MLSGVARYELLFVLMTFVGIRVISLLGKWKLLTLIGNGNSKLFPYDDFLLNTLTLDAELKLGDFVKLSPFSRKSVCIDLRFIIL